MTIHIKRGRIKDNLSAVVAPGANDGIERGYTIGSIWINISSNRIYICVDNASGAAIWDTVGGLATSEMALSGNPILNAAVTAAIIDAYSGVIITLTEAGNAQTLQNPTDTTAGKRFTVVVKGAFDIEVNGITMSAGEAQRFIWDGASWVAVTAVDADDITATPHGDIVAIKVQTYLDELEDEKINDVVDDTTPQLGGNLDKNGKGIIENITSHSATESVTVATMYGNLHKITGAYTLTLPSAVIGMSGIFRASTAAIFSIKAGASCHFEMIDGTVLDNGDKQTSGGTKNAWLHIHCETANVWITSGQHGTMEDTGA